MARYTGMFTGGAQDTIAKGDMVNLFRSHRHDTVGLSPLLDAVQEMAVHTVMKKCSATFGQTVAT